jgi:hypothetical protein
MPTAIEQARAQASEPGIIREWWFVLVVFALGTLLLYFPVLQNGFLADDYAALYRITIQHHFLYRESLRPLIDITFYLNYLLSGLHPAGYYIFNFVIHALTCCMVYRVALDLQLFEGAARYQFAWVAGILFLVYPFHNEGIVWLSGRLSTMAAFCGLLAVHFNLTKRWPLDFVLAAMCWLIGLFAYESIIVLPLILLVLRIPRYRTVAKPLRDIVAWSTTALIYMGLRWLIAGRLVPGYGSTRISGNHAIDIIIQGGKALGRCFLPPSEESGRFVVLTIIVVVAAAGLQVMVLRRMRAGARAGGYYLLPGVALIISLLPAIIFGVSTRTSEGDRLLYFPSCWLCMLTAVLLISLIRTIVVRGLLVLMILTGSVLFIRQNNRHWIFASRTFEAMLDTIRNTQPVNVILVNAPDEWEGAFIFRNNFYSALTVNGIDTGRVTVSHYLGRLEYLKAGEVIVPERLDSGLFIYPSTWIAGERDRGKLIYYWDKVQWKRVIL